MGCSAAKFKLDSDRIVCDDRVKREKDTRRRWRVLHEF